MRGGWRDCQPASFSSRRTIESQNGDNIKTTAGGALPRESAHRRGAARLTSRAARRQNRVSDAPSSSARLAAAAQAGDPRTQRPQAGDRFVFAGGERIGQTITPDDLLAGKPPVMVYPIDPSRRVVRDGSRLNQILLVRLAPDELDEDTRARSADGVVAYSGVCTHAGCDVTLWQTKRDDSGAHATNRSSIRGTRAVSWAAPRRAGSPGCRSKSSMARSSPAGASWAGPASSQAERERHRFTLHRSQRRTTMRRTKALVGVGTLLVATTAPAALLGGCTTPGMATSTTAMVPPG